MSVSEKERLPNCWCIALMGHCYCGWGTDHGTEHCDCMDYKVELLD